MYQAEGGSPVNEYSPPAPQSPCARTKAVCEEMFADIAVAGPRVLSLRYFNPVGTDPELRTGLQLNGPAMPWGCSSRHTRKAVRSRSRGRTTDTRRLGHQGLRARLESRRGSHRGDRAVRSLLGLLDTARAWAEAHLDELIDARETASLPAAPASAVTGKVHRLATPGTAPRRVVGVARVRPVRARSSALRCSPVASTAREVPPPPDAASPRQTFPATAPAQHCCLTHGDLPQCHGREHAAPRHPSFPESHVV
ncbi:hypothetical protein [Streptomyces sp. NPDC056672]|uniref:hypothetical protein n=1 Tax=Streptomyces sp. NPDC056672 TaxID=3345906 RepID=UPI0036C93665